MPTVVCNSMTLGFAHIFDFSVKCWSPTSHGLEVDACVSIPLLMQARIVARHWIALYMSTFWVPTSGANWDTTLGIVIVAFIVPWGMIQLMPWRRLAWDHTQPYWIWPACMDWRMICVIHCWQPVLICSCVTHEWMTTDPLVFKSAVSFDAHVLYWCGKVVSIFWPAN